MAKVNTTINVADLSPVSDILRVIADAADRLPADVIEKLQAVANGQFRTGADEVERLGIHCGDVTVIVNGEKRERVIYVDPVMREVGTADGPIRPKSAAIIAPNGEVICQFTRNPCEPQTPGTNP